MWPTRGLRAALRAERCCGAGRFDDLHGVGGEPDLEYGDGDDSDQRASRCIATSDATPTGKVYVVCNDSQVMTVIETDTDTMDTTIPLQGYGVSVRMTRRKARLRLIRLPGRGSRLWL